jgi:predicted Fe-S protein YdhL (DUF1289 family)
MIKSPCIEKCEMNPYTKLCEGCHRNIDEIVNWSSLNDNQKNYVLKLIKKRKDA